MTTASHTNETSDSLLSDCLSEASRHHERDASRGVSPASSSRSWSTHSRGQSPFRPESPYYDSQTSAMETSTHHTTTNLSQIDMWRTAIPGSRPVATFQIERPQKCPVTSCEYHTKGFQRRHDRIRHTLTHYEGIMVCGYCPGNETAAAKSFYRTDVFKRHLVNAHSVIQMPPDTFIGPIIPGTKTLSEYAPGATGECSICRSVFFNAQDFYEHLDDCALKEIVWQQDASCKETPPEERGYATESFTLCASPSIDHQSMKELPLTSSRKRKYEAETPGSITAVEQPISVVLSTTSEFLELIELPGPSSSVPASANAGQIFEEQVEEQNDYKQKSKNPPTRQSTYLQGGTEEALQSLQNIDPSLFIDQSHPSHFNRGKVASVSATGSGNLVTCDTCHRFTGRPSELKYAVWPCRSNFKLTSQQKTSKTALQTVRLYVFGLQKIFRK
jgi:hypothetical protein